MGASGACAKIQEIFRRMLTARGVTDLKEHEVRAVASLIKNTMDRYDGKAVQPHGIKKFRR